MHVHTARVCARRTAFVVWPGAAPWPKSRPPVRRLWECGECGGARLIKLCTLALSCFPYRQGTSDHTGGQNEELPPAAAFPHVGVGTFGFWQQRPHLWEQSHFSLAEDVWCIMQDAVAGSLKWVECCFYFKFSYSAEINGRYHLIIKTSFGANYLCRGRKVASQSWT